MYRRFFVLMDAAVKKNGKRTIVWEGFGREPNSKFPIPKDVIVMICENRFYAPHHLVEIANLRWPLAAMSERGWNTEAGKSWPNFQKRLSCFPP